MKYCPECKSSLATKNIDGIERLCCDAKDCDFVEWQNPVPVVAALVVYHNKLLLARNTLWPEGMYSMISGYLERSEAPELAISRELNEELGLTASNVRFIGHYPFPKKNQLIIAYAIIANGNIALGQELAEVQMIELSELDHLKLENLELTARIVSDWRNLTGL
ncbi:MAG: NUDIX domain-containing protein [Gammaproteobacteria bacterium]|nr:NUDIX domain-containing protein [Gammaproteobacteria bacterium]